MKQNNHNLSPAKYWRDNKSWSKIIGKTATVLFATNIDNLYSYVLLELNYDKGQRIECMSEVNVFLQAGDKVVLHLRKLSESSENALINYGIKAIKIYE